MKRKSPKEIIDISQKLYDSMHSCRLCPQDCGVNRFEGQPGKCKSTHELKIASINLHFGEEPPLSGGGGSGTVFLSGCSLSCKYCQNYPISHLNTGRVYTSEQLSEQMLNLGDRGADNINFVTPGHMVPMILKAIGLARQEGLDIPIVYNCSGYEKIEILELLDGIIDIYLPDMRYNDDDIARTYSGCDNYVETNRAAILEMYRQVGLFEVNEKGIGQRGLIIRHLVLPEGLSGSDGIFEFLANDVSNEVFVSLMSQYFPAHAAVDDRKVDRRITSSEFNRTVEAFEAAGLTNGFIQSMAHEKV